MVFSQRCAGCNQPGAELCRPCRFALVSAMAVSTSDGVVAAFEFDGVARNVLLGLKFRNRRRLAAHMADLMVRRARPGETDVVTWAPTSSAHLRRRGYDQAELLARAVARRLGVPCRRLLYRSHGEGQTGLGRAQRLVGPRFRARPLGDGLRVLLVDDVVTTGATLRAASLTLRQAGAAEVVALAAAATPHRVRMAPTLVRPVQRAVLRLVG